MDESYETARRILTEHMTELHRVAGVLMEREKISGEEFDALMKGENLAPFGLDSPRACRSLCIGRAARRAGTALRTV